MMRAALQTDWFSSRLFQAIAWTVLAFFALVQIAGILGTPLYKYDDAIPLVSADLVMHGRKPAVDFVSFYPPLFYYALAAGFQLFGRTMLVYRLLAVGLGAAVVFVAARFFLSSFPAFRSLLACMLLSIVVALGVMPAPPSPGFTLALFSLMAYIKGTQSDRYRLRWIALAGLLGGISTLIRFNFGPYAMAVIVTDILMQGLFPTFEPLHIRLKRALLQMSALVIPFGISNIIFYLCLYGANALSTPLYMIWYLTTVMTASAFLTIHIHGPSLFYLALPCAWMFMRQVLQSRRVGSGALLCAAAAALIPGLGVAGRHMHSISLLLPAVSFILVIALHLTVSPVPRAALLLLLFYICNEHYFLIRADLMHVLFFPLLIAMTLPFLFTRPHEIALEPLGQRRPDQQGQDFALKVRVFVTSCALTFLLASGIPAVGYGTQQSITYAKDILAMLKSGRLNRCDRERLLFSDPSLLDELKATEFVRQRTAPSEAIYIGSQTHAKPFLTSVRAYWLSERLPGTKFLNLDILIGAGKSVQQEIIDDLYRNGVKCAILLDTGNEEDRTFEKPPPGSKVLDEYFAEQFHQVAQFGNYSVVIRR